MAENQNAENAQFINYVRQKFEKANFKSTNEYAFKSFLSFSAKNQIESITKVDLTHWIVTLLMKEKSASTVKRYFCKLHVVYLDWIKENEQQYSLSNTSENRIDPFEGLIALTTPENQVKSAEVHSNIDLIKKLVTTDTYKGDGGIMKALFFYLLYNPDLSLSDVVNLKLVEVPKYCPQTVEILESMDKSNGRKYLFPLNQPDKRETQITREIREGILNQLKAVGMKFDYGFTRERMTAMWICAAIRLGIKVGDIKAIVSVIPEEYKILENIIPSKLSEKERQDIICRVANRLHDVTTRWYVVNMRDKVTPDIVKDTLMEYFPVQIGQMSFFYPTHNAYREGRNKKKVKVEVPFIPGLLFIKVRSDLVAQVMSNIRNVAWGFKYLNTPSSPYSVISQRAMIDFQRHIGEFTDDIRMEMMTDKAPLAVNDLVTVYGDSIDGSIGEITEIKEKNGVKTFSIKLTHNTSFSWTIKISDELRIQPLSEIQKRELSQKDRI